MTIPLATLNSVKDLLRLPTTDTTQDTALSNSYDKVLTEFCLKTDILAETEQISSVARQHIYSASSRFARILSVIFNRLALVRSASVSLDWYVPLWQSNPPSRQPEVFTLEKIPPQMDGFTAVTPEQFAVYPAPSNTATGDNGFTLFQIDVPTGTPATQYIMPYLIYATAADFLSNETEIRENPSAQFWQQIADIWYAVIERLVGGKE